MIDETNKIDLTKHKKADSLLLNYLHIYSTVKVIPTLYNKKEVFQFDLNEDNKQKQTIFVYLNKSVNCIVEINCNDIIIKTGARINIVNNQGFLNTLNNIKPPCCKYPNLYSNDVFIKLIAEHFRLNYKSIALNALNDFYDIDTNKMEFDLHNNKPEIIGVNRKVNQDFKLTYFNEVSTTFGVELLKKSRTLLKPNHTTVKDTVNLFLDGYLTGLTLDDIDLISFDVRNQDAVDASGDSEFRF